MMRDSNQRGYVVVLALCTVALILGTLTYFYYAFEVSRRPFYLDKCHNEPRLNL